MNALTRPEPLTPADCDLRAFDWFPLYHKRLIRSRFWIVSSSDVKVASVELWCEAYQQVPAGSLPDDDYLLAQVCGFGRRDLAGWMALKPEVMGAWIQCSDGRWYHPTLCEIANEAWANRKKTRERERLKKQRQRHGKSDDSLGENAGVPEGDGPLVPGGPRDRQGQRQGQGQDISDGSEDPSGDLDGAGDDEEGFGDAPAGSLPAVPKAEPVQVAFEAFNHLATDLGLSVARKLNDARRQKLKARLDEYGIEGWAEALEAVRRNPFLRGEEGNWGGATLDFLLQASSFQKVIEGGYDRRTRNNGNQPATLGADRRPSVIDGAFERMQRGALEALNRGGGFVRGGPPDRD